MKTNISSRDWELLSEYLDRHLSPAKQAKLEARLSRDAELRSALADLQRTRLVLRSAPRLKAPRSFTLKPHMVPQRQPRRIYPVFQFASALASILLVLVLVGDLLDVSLFVQSPQPASVPAPEMQVLVEQEAAVMAVPEEEGPVESFERMMVPEEALESEAYPPPAVLMAPAEPGSAAGDAAGLAAEDMEKLAPRAGSEDQRVVVPEEQVVISQDASPIWRYLQVSLALIALASAVLAVYFKRVGT